jgi:hypothetical protein
MDLRRQHRIIYQTKIRMRAPDRDESVVARVQNLSARGMFVTANDLPAAGAEVQCRLTLGGERRTLRGRVAWVRQSSPATPLKSPGAGIEFIDLDSQVAELLTRLVEPDDDRRQSVDVWFEGMAAPIRCYAVVVGGGLRLETRLPFMRLSSAVKVAFTQESPPSTREGIVDGVSLEPSQSDGVPFLRVAVTMPPLDSARGTIEAQKNGRAAKNGEALALGSTLVDPAVNTTSNGNGAQVAVRTSQRDRSETTQRIPIDEIVPPESKEAVPSATDKGIAGWLGGITADDRVPQWARPVVSVIRRGGRLSYLVAGVALGALLVAVTAGDAAPKKVEGEASVPTSQAAETSKNVGAASAASRAQKAATAAAPAATTTKKAVPTTAATANRGDKTAEATGDKTAEPAPIAAIAVEQERAAERPVAAGATGTPGPEIEQLAPPASGDAKSAGITVATDANRTVVVTVPLEGNTARAFTKSIHYTDRDIVGLALLRARPLGDIGVGVIQPPGSPARVLIRRRGVGSLVRFAFDARKYNAKLLQEGNALRLTLLPKR